MILLPAIDIKNSRCVRLRQGVKDDEKVYANDPVAMAEYFSSIGADYIHIIDLDGAFDGVPKNLELIEKISQKIDTPFEIGGGIRDAQTIEHYLNAGASRVIIGTKAIEDIGFLKEMIDLYGEKIAVSLDAKDGIVYTRGWTESSNTSVLEQAKLLEDLGLSTLIYTDISRDGMLCGPDYEMLDKLNTFDFDIIASGGISDISEIEELSKRDLYGTITGKAVYEGKIDLEKYLKESKHVS